MSARSSLKKLEKEKWPKAGYVPLTNPYFSCLKFCLFCQIIEDGDGRKIFGWERFYLVVTEGAFKCQDRPDWTALRFGPSVVIRSRACETFYPVDGRGSGWVIKR